MAGFVGVGLYLAAYAALQLGFLRGSGYLYAIINAIAAGLVLVSLVDAFNLFSAMSQVMWITISLVGIARIYWINTFTRFDANEAELIKKMLPELTKAQTRRFLNTGEWRECGPGTSLIQEGEPVFSLYYLSSGSVQVSKDGLTVAKDQHGTFIGEITCFTGNPATATVTTNQDSLLLCLDVKVQRPFLEKNPDIHRGLEQSIAHNLRAKLTTSNENAIETKEFISSHRVLAR